MIELYVDTAPCTWDLAWQEEAYGYDSDFNEHFVILGNRDYKEIDSASWWTKANQIIRDLEDSDEEYKLEEYDKELSKKVRKRIIDAYDHWDGRDQEEFMCDILNIIYPWKEYQTRCIRGYSQGEWNMIIFAKEDEEFVDRIEAFYFGQISEIHYLDTETEDTCWGWITNDEAWRWDREGKILEEIKAFFGLPDDEEYKVYKNENYNITEWEEVSA